MTKSSKLIDIEAIKKFYKEAKHFMLAQDPDEARYRIKIEAELKKQLYPSIRFAFIVLGVVIGIFVLWGGTAPLDSASIAGGHVVLSGNRKLIQHLEGGVIEKILVNDGDEVKEGQDLVVLNPSNAKSGAESTLSHLRTALVSERRLMAEESGDEAIDFDNELLDRNDPEVQRLIANQQHLFNTRRRAIQGTIDILNQQIMQKQEEIIGYEAHLKSLSSQFNMTKERLAGAESLFAKGLLTKIELFEIRKAYQNTEAELVRVKAAITSSKQLIEEYKLKILSTENEYAHKISEEYKSNHASLLDYQARYQGFLDTLNRTVIKAPASGIVSALQHHTVGGVIRGGERIMEIIPQNDDLIVEAYIQIQDINNIHIGTMAKVQLNPYKQRLVPRIDGEVIYVSADRITSDRPVMFNDKGHPVSEYYLARVKLNQQEIQNLNTEVKLYPGMPVTVFLIRGTRTFLQYMISPITDSFHRAFKEQ